MLIDSKKIVDWIENHWTYIYQGHGKIVDYAQLIEAIKEMETKAKKQESTSCPRCKTMRCDLCKHLDNLNRQANQS